MNATLHLASNVETTPERGPDVNKWVDIDQAAEILDRHTNHISRECRDKLERLGLACKAKPAGGGQAKWFIARRYDLRLAPGAAGEVHQAPDLSMYSRKQVDDAYARADCVMAFRDARSHWSGKQATWLPRLVKKLKERHDNLKISGRSLRRWYNDYQTQSDLIKLISGAGGNRKQDADPACWQAFKNIYLTESCPSLASCWRQVDDYAIQNNLLWISIDACRSQLNGRISPEDQARYRTPKIYRNSYQPHMEHNPEEHDAGERWDGDHCVLDLLCWDGEGSSRKMIRPWLTAWIDWRTRKIVGWHLSNGPNSQTILSAFRQAMLDESNLGGPSEVHIDNGRDYDSYTLQGQTKAERRKAKRDKLLMRESGRLARINGGMRIDENKAKFGVFHLLDIKTHFGTPYNPTSKARMERWFGTLHGAFDKNFATYCGPTTDKRPEELAKQCKEKPHIVPTFEAVLTALQSYIKEYNDTVSLTRKGAEGYSPNQAMTALPHTIRKVDDPNILRNCLAMWHKPVSVGRNGVRICVGTVAYTYGRFEEQLRRLKGTGKKVHVSYDPDDMSNVEVYDEAGRHLCTAGLNERTSQGKVNHNDVKKTMAARRKRTKQRVELNDTAVTDVLTMTPQRAAAMAKREEQRASRPAILMPKPLADSDVKVETRTLGLQAKPSKTQLEQLLRKAAVNMPDLAKLRPQKPQKDDSVLGSINLETLRDESLHDDQSEDVLNLAVASGMSGGGGAA